MKEGIAIINLVDRFRKENVKNDEVYYLITYNLEKALTKKYFELNPGLNQETLKSNKKPLFLFNEKKKFEKYTYKQLSEEERKGYLSQIQRLKELLTFQNKNIGIRKKETRLCEICRQIRQDNFKHSRISANGFNISRNYRICSFCQK